MSDTVVVIPLSHEGRKAMAQYDLDVGRLQGRWPTRDRVIFAPSQVLWLSQNRNDTNKLLVKLDQKFAIPSV